MRNAQSPVVIATIMRAEGETGAQSHFNAFHRYLSNARIGRVLITPYSAPKVLVYPMFAVRRMLELLRRALNVWWYRIWHRFVLKRVLRTVLRRETPTVGIARTQLRHAAFLLSGASPDFAASQPVAL